MKKFKIGDEVVVKVNVGTTTDPWLQTLKVQIIGFGNGANNDQTLCYVPQYENLKTSFSLNRLHQRHYDFHNKFLGEFGTFVNESDVIKHIPSPEGAVCVRCNDFVMLAEQADDFLCRPCKENPWR